MDYREKEPVISIMGHEAEINSIDFNPENEFLYITGSSDKTAALWDLRKPDLKLHSFIHHKNSILNVKWNNRRSNIFASSGEDNKILIWDLTQIGANIARDDNEEAPSEMIFEHGGHLDKINDFDWNQNEDMMFSTNYNQKYGERPSIYNILFEKMKQGKISCEYLEELLFRVSLVEQIPNVQYRQIFEEYAYRKTGNPKDAEILLDRIIDRKNNISEKVEQLVNELYNEFSKNKLAQADNLQRDSIPLQDMVKNAICSGVSLENINEYDMSSKGNEQEYKKVRNEEI